MNATSQKLPVKTKLLFGFGSIAYGVKDNGFAVFLLFYYNQVVGMRADLVSLAIAIALFADAFFDPLVGQLSDRTRTRLGQRHPWIYGSAIPIAIAWLLLWHPPETSGLTQFFYLLGTAMLVRFSLSLYEVPSLALVPELTRDYHERTSVLRFRFLFGWIGGLAMMFLAYAIFLIPSEKYPVGLLNIDGYSTFAIVGAIGMVIAVFVAGAGTHRRIIDAYRKTGKHPETAESFAQMITTFRFQPFLMLLFAGVFAFASQGLIFALMPYLFAHVWEFGAREFSLYSLILFLAIFTAFLLVAPISKWLGKPKAASRLMLISLLAGTLPYWLRLANVFPQNGSTLLLPALFTLIVISIAAGITVMILTFSMMADVTDAYEVDSAKRTEGLFSAGMFFMQKMVGGLGILMSGLIISIIHLPERATPGSVEPAIVDQLTLIFAVSLTIIGLIGAWAYSLFPLSEKDHVDRLEELAARDSFSA